MLTERAIPDLSDPASFVEAVPYAAFAELRRRPGLYWQPSEHGTAHGGFWAVTRHADIIEIEKHPELFTSTRGAAYPATNLPPDNRGKDGLMLMDPPRHSRVRRVAASSFGPRVVRNFDPWVRAIVRETLDRIEELPWFDYVTEVAAMIPSLVIARVMGVPDRDRHLIVEWANRSFAAQQIQDESRNAQQMAVQGTMFQYLQEVLVPERRESPKDDMTSVLLQAAAEEDITPEECLHFLLLLLLAGYETTHTLIGQSMRMMLEDPTVEQAVLVGTVELGSDRVSDEFLRTVTPTMNMARTATTETEIAGQAIRAGDLMQMYFISANRDETVFTEPDRFDPWRPETNHIAFGSGAHRCMGSALAKLELRILFEEMQARGVQLQLEGEPRRGRSVFINQLTSLPVRRKR